MRLNFTLVFLALFLCSASQDLTDSLSKYSYLIQAKTPGTKLQATGFFARYQQRLFFITAAHCITGWDPFQFKKIDGFPDTLFIRTSNDTGRLHYLSLPVADIKRSTQPFHDYEVPDVYVIEIKNPKRYPVYSVEKYFNERPRCESIKSIWVSGYSHKEDYNEYFTDRQQPLTVTAILGDAYCFYPFRPEAKRPDQLNYVTQFDDNGAKGLSGAPAYLLTENKHIVFGGLYIGGGNGLRTGMVVRPEYVIDKIISEINGGKTASR